MQTRQSAIGQFFSLSPVTVPEVFARVDSSTLLLVSKVANGVFTFTANS